MALSNLGPHLIFDQVGDFQLDDRYLNGSVYCGFERADMDRNRIAFDQLMQGPRFLPLLHHMAITASLGMQWNYFRDDIFVDSKQVKHHVCSHCKHFAALKCSCRSVFYCSVKCQRASWSKHKLVCASRK